MILAKKICYRLVLIMLFVASIFPVPATAACTPKRPGEICNPIPSITSIPNLIQTIIEGVVKIALPVLALAIIYCGFQYVAARGNSEKITKAHESLLWTLVGAAILLGSWALAKLMEATVTGLS